MALFLSTYNNKIDKKGRVSVPAQFRNMLSKKNDLMTDASEIFNGVIIYRSFINDCIEACSMQYMEQISQTIDNLDPYSAEKDAFATAILGGSIQLSFDGDGRITVPQHILQQSSITNQAVFVGKGKTFEIWNPDIFNQYLEKSRDLASQKRAYLSFKNNIKPEGQA
ncbi:MAG: cell division/cell wall cluster transcriptional repressor MraZ [Pseudomonadota bacterium]